jgi:DNA polymerase III delta subunit
VDRTSRKWKAEDAAKVVEAMAQLDLQIKTGKANASDALLMLISLL